MTYDVATLTALASGALVLRDYVTVFGKTLGGSDKTFAYWTGESNITTSVVPAGETEGENRNFAGVGTLKTVPDIVDAIGMEARSVEFGFDHINTSTDSPMDMVFGNNVRVARVEYHKGILNPNTWELAAVPHLMLAGRVDGVSVNDAAIDGEGGLQIVVANDSIDLTKINPAMESSAQQILRGGDLFRQYGDTATQRERFWGLARA
jgi:hypothetical protein